MLSRITGLIRETLIARAFGASVYTDAFNVAFRIPNLLRRLSAEGAFSQAFVPILGEFKNRQGETETRALVDAVATVMTWLLVVISALGVIAAPLIVTAVATGFKEHESQAYISAIFMTRVMFPYIGLVSLVALASGILNTWRQFGIPAFTPVLLNLSFIVAAVFVAPFLETPIYAQAYAVMVGGILQLAIQIPSLRRVGMLPRVSFNVRAAWHHPGVRRVLKAGEEATKKNLKIAGGLMSRHYKPLEEAVRQVHEGVIGEVITCWAYREHGPVGFRPRRPDMNELAHHIQNYSCFTWMNGSFILDWLIHNIDVCCWVKDAWPVSAQGQGGRQVRDQPDQLFDHYAVEYTFDDGKRLIAQGRHMANCWGFFGDVIHGSAGSAVLGEGIKESRIYKTHQQSADNLIWQYEGPPSNPYQVEHDRLFKAIRQDTPYNETERCAYAALVGIMGRMAAESGKQITWEQALNSNVELFPGLEQVTSLDAPAPVEPDAQGNYPTAMPGFTRVL
jgi:hypothetical protein